jgi:antitoxin ParD1/3/4
MKHTDFVIGETFWCNGRGWRCTDIGTRTIITICLDGVGIDSNVAELRRTLNQNDAEAEGWFAGPPYAVAETVFDEDDLPACSPEPEPEPDHADEAMPDPEADYGARATTVGRARAAAIRDQAVAGGLRFEAYLPPGLAEWLIDLIASGVFTDPSEATFVMLGEQQELEPHSDLREELMRRSCQAALDDPRPGITTEEMQERLRAWSSAPRVEPAVWRRAPR